MRDETQVTELFERAVAGVPPALLPPPHAAIRRRVRRRRATGWGVVAVAALAVLAGVALARPGPTAGRPEPAASTVAPVVPGVPWHTARIDRTGTRITVYAMPLPGKCVDRDPGGDRIDWDDSGVALYLAGTYIGCANDGEVSTRTFELAQAVGARVVLDAREPAGARIVVRDAELPDLAAGGWTEQPARWYGVGAAALTFRYTRPGAPDLWVQVSRWDAGPDDRLGTPDHTLSVDGRTVDVYDRQGVRAAGWWSTDGQVRLTLWAPTVHLEKSELDGIVRGMTWS